MEGRLGQQGLRLASPRASELWGAKAAPRLLAIGACVPQWWAMNSSPSASLAFADRYAPDGPYAFARLGLSLLISTLVGAGMWAIIVVLPQAQLEFGVDRSAASLPYTLMMCTLAFATIALGRMTDRAGIVAPLAISGATPRRRLCPRRATRRTCSCFPLAHVLIGVGAGTGFGPMMADISHWFVKRRGLAVVVVASGNYVAGTIWPLLMSLADAAHRLAGDLRRHRPHHRRDGLAVGSADAPAPVGRGVRRSRGGDRGRRAPTSAFRRGCCWFCSFSPAFPAVWRCRCRRSISSPIAATSATASRAAPKCFR